MFGRKLMQCTGCRSIVSTEDLRSNICEDCTEILTVINEEKKYD